MLRAPAARAMNAISSKEGQETHKQLLVHRRPASNDKKKTMKKERARGRSPRREPRDDDIRPPRSSHDARTATVAFVRTLEIDNGAVDDTSLRIA